MFTDAYVIVLWSLPLRGGPVTLDFGAGLIRHATTIDDDGIEWSRDIVHGLEHGQSSSIGKLVFHKNYWYS